MILLKFLLVMAVPLVMGWLVVEYFFGEPSSYVPPSDFHDDGY